MKRKVKIWMIWSYLFVLALFLMIYLGIRHRTERNIRELYVEKQLAVMNQTMLAVDEHVEMVMKMCLGIIQEPYVRYFPYVGPDLSRYGIENSAKLLKNIRDHYTADPFVEDFYIFYENSGRIAHANGFYREEDFYQMEWSYEEEDMQRQVRELFLQGQTNVLPAARMRNGSKRTENITFIYDFGGQREDGESRTAKLVVLLKKAWLDDMVRDISINGRTSIRRAGDGLELYGFHGNAGLEDFSRQEAKEGKLSHVVTWNGSRYLLTCLNSEDTGWSYESVIPYEGIRDQMQDALSPMSAGLFVYLLVGFPACLLMAGWNYMPIRQLTSHMEAIGFPAKAGQNNEIEYIRSGISNLHKKYEELELKYGSAMQEFDSASGKLKKNRERIQEGVLRQLIGGYWRDDQELAERLETLGIVFPYPKFCIITIQVEGEKRKEPDGEPEGGFGKKTAEAEAGSAAREKSLRLFVLKNVAQEYLQPFGLVFPVSEGPDQLFLLMNLSEQGYAGEEISTELEGLMLRMMEYFKKEMQIDISLGVGTLCSRISQLSESRRMSKRALEYCFIIGKASLVIYDRIRQEEGQSYCYDERIGKQLLGCVIQKDDEACCLLLDQLYEDALKQRISVSQGKHLHMLLADAAMKTIGKSNADPKKCEEYQDMVAGILSRETLPEVFPAIKELFVMLCRERRESGGEQELAERVMSYLEEHYWDPAFSLQMCAEHFGMSPEHLSRTIKALTGRKFIDIVNSLRLERAKRYLLETDKKMEEIAELSGYGTAKTFFRSFKQAEGVPPGVWRKQMRDQKEML